MRLKTPSLRVFSWAVFFSFIVHGPSVSQQTGSFKTSTADFDLTPTLRQAYTELSKLRLQAGRSLLAREPRNGLTIYLTDYADMLQLLVAEDRPLYESLRNQEDERLRQIRRLDAASPWNRFIQAEIKLHWAFVNIKFGHETSGAWSIIQAYRLLEENARRFPAFLPNQKALGLLHVLIGSTPENYRWVTNLLGLRGNVAQGVREIRNVASHDALFTDEARLTDFLIHVYILQTTDEQRLDFQKFVAQRTDNLLLSFFGTSALIKEGHSEEARTLLNARPTGPAYLTVPFFEYYRGEILVEKGQYPAASAAYRSFLSQHKGRNFVKDATYKLALCQWLQNNDASARSLLAEVTRVGQTTVEPDKVAQRFAEQFTDLEKEGRSEAQKVLMRARLSCDGGYYEQAISTLQRFSETNFPAPRDRAEFNYRRARIYHRSADSSRAVPFYERTLALSEGQTWYFGAMSALQLGYIWQAKGQKQKARVFFEKALAFRKHEYKNSVDNKAKAALNELGY